MKIKNLQKQKAVISERGTQGGNINAGGMDEVYNSMSNFNMSARNLMPNSAHTPHGSYANNLNHAASYASIHMTAHSAPNLLANPRFFLSCVCLCVCVCLFVCKLNLTQFFDFFDFFFVCVWLWTSQHRRARSNQSRPNDWWEQKLHGFKQMPSIWEIAIWKKHTVWT